MSRGYLVLDIETVPDPDLYERPEVATGQERPFPPLYTHRPIVLGVLWLDEGYAFKRLGVIGEEKDEAGMLADFAKFADEYRPHLVTYNGRSFDLPVLALRALRHGVHFGWYYRGGGYRYRFSEEGHLDLGDVIADFGAARMTSLDGAAKLIGLPGKVGVDGSQVEGLFEAGEMGALRRYCLSDVAQTAFVYLRYKLVTGDIDLPTYRKVADEFLRALQNDGRFEPLIAACDRERLLLPEGSSREASSREASSSEASSSDAPASEASVPESSSPEGSSA